MNDTRMRTLPGARTASAPPADAGRKGADDADSRRAILNRLKRASGQLDAVIAGIEQGRSCRDTITQLSAVKKALSRVGFLIVTTSMRECLGADDGPTTDPGTEAAPDVRELEKLFLMLA